MFSPSRWASRFRIRQLTEPSMWILPSCYVAGALVLGILTPRLDRRLAVTTSFLPEPENARAILSAIGTGMITLTGFVFSFLLLMVQFGSTAFTPRLTRTLQRDWVIKNALGAFTATFVFSLSALAAVERFGPVAPLLTTLTATVLLLSSVALFFAMISRAVNSLRASHVINTLTARGHEVLDTTYPRPYGSAAGQAGDTSTEQPAAPATTRLIQVVRHRSRTPAILVALDRDGLARLARRAGVVIEHVPAVGDDVGPGSDLLRVYGHRQVPEKVLRSSLVLGDERTLEDDPGFALRLLVDIAIRGLSPAINDPTTAVRALDGIDELLSHAAARDLVGEHAAPAGDAPLIGPVPTWEDLLRLGVTEVRLYGRGSVQVLRRLRALLENLLESAPPPRHTAVRQELERLDTSIAESFGREEDRLIASRPDPQGLGPSR